MTFQSVGVRSQLDAHARRGLAVVAGRRCVAFLPQFHTGHVPEAYGGAIGIDAQQDALEFRNGRELFLRLDGDVHLLPVPDGLAADFPERNLFVLGLHRIDHVGRRQAV